MGTVDLSDIDALLAAPMYDDVPDTSSWDSLFEQPFKADPGPASTSTLDTRFVREKRTAIVMGTDESPRPSKLLRAASSEFDRLANSIATPIEQPKELSKELPPIVVRDPSDPKAVRRARNTAAARRSRDKKREHLQELEDRIAELERINAELAIENQFLKSLQPAGDDSEGLKSGI